MIEKNTLISSTLNIPNNKVTSVIKLLEEGATIPFIARYRKEATGALDEVQITDIKNELNKLNELEKRKETICKAIEEQNALTPELKQQILTCFDSNLLEDLYLPYKKKKTTKAAIAKKNGLEPLAKLIMMQNKDEIEQLARPFIKNNIKTFEEAIEGAKHIIAEWVNERQKARNILLILIKKEGIIKSKVAKNKKIEAEKYKDYFDFSEPITRIKSHRLLALYRGEKENLLKIKFDINKETALAKLNPIFITARNKSSQIVSQAIEEAYKRLLKPAIETEIRNQLKEKADEEAITVFSENLRQLLLASPVGEKKVLAIDPGFRTGCKVVCLGNNGELLHNETIYPHPPKKDIKTAKKKIDTLVQQYKIEVIAIGNGTAGRETEYFIKSIKFDRELQVFIVSEDGASIYSASKVAREEFPQYDVTVRGAVSIGRRLMDPLAELVKIEPKSLGIGQYQHDVNQKKLKETLDDVVMSCVNKVGVNVNTASKYLLTYVSGLGEQLAANIIEYRNETGQFTNRNELKKVKRMGEKAFEQAAGFLRISNGDNPLDNSSVHPESYYMVTKIAQDLNTQLPDLIGNKELLKTINLNQYTNNQLGTIALTDILNELAKPGLDPRKKAKIFSFSDELKTIEDVKQGMEIPGIVTNITNFGAFVDIGIKENGLIHISNMAKEYISNPADILRIHQHVKVQVISIDAERKRIGLSLELN